MPHRPPRGRPGPDPTPATPAPSFDDPAPAGAPAPESVELRERSETQRIADAIVQAYKTQYGKGPESIRVHLTGDTVMAVLRGGFSIVEESLRTSGQAAVVRDQRRAFGDMIAPTLAGAVSGVIGREVVAVLADTCQQPDLTAIVVVLGPRPPAAGG